MIAWRWEREAGQVGDKGAERQGKSRWEMGTYGQRREFIVFVKLILNSKIIVLFTSEHS